MAGRFAYPRFIAVQAGEVLPGAKLYVYENNTTTPTNSYTDRAAGTPNANPVVMDANGEADVWLPEGSQYTLKLTTSADVEVWTKNDVSTNDLSTWVTTGSDVYFSAGSVFIGASSGSATLDVTGTVAISSTLAVTGSTTVTTLTASGAITANAGIVLGDDDNITFGDSSDATIDYVSATDSLYINNSTLSIYIDVGGNNQIRMEGGTVVTPIAQTTYASLNVPHGTAPTTPSDGDIWTTTAGLYVRINGSTVGPLS